MIRVHTCSAGCTEPGCSRRYRDHIERLKVAGDALDDAIQTYFELLPTLLNEVRAKAFLKGRKASREWEAIKKGFKS